ncbi:MAG TPA: FtsX-like permease family protein [Mycobacteriales bacterium]|nr:FtsX-like permease family protein [Mycobacteriales bacterium]
MLRATLKSLFARKLRLLLSALAVLLGVTFVAGAFILTDTMGKGFDKLFDTVNANVAVDIRGHKTLGGKGDTRTEIPTSVLATAKNVPGVREAQPSISGTAILIAKDGKALTSSGAPTLGTNWIASTLLNPMHLTSGKPPTSADQIVIDAGLAKDADYQVGDAAKVNTPSGTVDVHISGIGEYSNGSESLAGSRVVAFDTATAKRLLVADRGYTEVQLAADKGVSQTELRDRVAKVLPAGAQAITGDKLNDENSKDIKKVLGYFNTFLLVFAAVALFVGAFIIVNTFNILIAQRTRELALMRALGASRQQVNRSVLLEATLIGLIASLLGLAAGVGVAVGLQQLFASQGTKLPDSGIVIAARTIIATFVVGIGVTVAAAMLPARRAGKVPPLAAMRDAATPDRPMHRQVVIGGVLFVIGGVGVGLGLAGTVSLLLLGLSVLVGFIGIALLSPLLSRPAASLLAAPFSRRVPGKLGRENSRRNPRRTAATAAALMVGISLVSAVSVLGASLKKSTDAIVNQGLIADYAVVPQNGVDTAAAEAARKTDGVADVSTMQNGQVRIGNKVSYVSAYSPGTIGTTLDFEPESGDVGDISGNQMLVSKSTAKDRHWHVGTTVRAQYPDGTSGKLTVTGIYQDSQLLGGFAVSQSVGAHFNQHQLSGFFIKADDGRAGAKLQSALDKALKPYPTADVKSRKDLQSDIANGIDQVIMIVNILLVLSIIIAVLGIINTLALSVLERTRELGLLRAIGMSRRQVKRMIRIESVVISVFGGLLGLIVGSGLGLLLQRSFADDGLSKFAFPGGQLVLFLALSAVAGIVAAWVPARRAAKLDVLTAIATD